MTLTHSSAYLSKWSITKFLENFKGWSCAPGIIQSYNKHLQHLNISAAALSSQLLFPYHEQFSQVTILIQISTWFPTFLGGFDIPVHNPTSPHLQLSQGDTMLHKVGVLSN